MDRQQQERRLVEEMRSRFPVLVADNGSALSHVFERPDLVIHEHRLLRQRRGQPYEPQTEAEFNQENRAVRRVLEFAVRHRPRQTVDFVNPWGNDIPYDEDAERRMLQSPRSSSPENSIAEAFSDDGYDEEAEMRMMNAESPTSPAEMFELGDLDDFDPTHPLNF